MAGWAVAWGAVPRHSTVRVPASIEVLSVFYGVFTSAERTPPEAASDFPRGVRRTNCAADLSKAKTRRRRGAYRARQIRSTLAPTGSPDATGSQVTETGDGTNAWRRAYCQVFDLRARWFLAGPGGPRGARRPAGTDGPGRPVLGEAAFESQRSRTRPEATMARRGRQSAAGGQPVRGRARG
jgi:hypothetical protein